MVAIFYLGGSGTSMHQIVALKSSRLKEPYLKTKYMCVAYIILKNYLIEFDENLIFVFRDIRNVVMIYNLSVKSNPRLSGTRSNYYKLYVHWRRFVRGLRYINSNR